MRQLVLIAAALSLLSVAMPAGAQTIDKNGRCHGKDGKFAKADVCATVGKPTVVHTYTLNKAGKCVDEKSKFAKADLCKH